ncbi:hypothetical protein Ddye_021436 [Dipteronia dyeriana]|uniref:Uncharacterized protein n=1 Tax=Dipteronia dyeriana TaxID=168575 RepID=A0AAD9U1N1_9ROSI|nr:hypothetical protein Ddye_021436 [Dipteronia dyeriana]
MAFQLIFYRLKVLDWFMRVNAEKFKIRNEYILADLELYRAADRDGIEELIKGVAMAGLVNVVHQLGDLTEFAAEIFHELYEEVMVTSTIGHGLMIRVQQLETEFPSFEKAFLSQTNHTPFFSNTDHKRSIRRSMIYSRRLKWADPGDSLFCYFNPGIEWHPNMCMEQNLITRGDLPRCVMYSYEECRGPSRLFLLDKYDHPNILEIFT